MKFNLFLGLFLGSVLGFAQQQYEVFFDFNKDVPNATSLTLLQQWIANHKSAEIIKISGYCDSVDDSNYNKELALKRIKNVLLLLQKDSIKLSNDLELKPFGKDFRRSKKQEENRKVVFYYQQKEHAASKDKEIVIKADKEISPFDIQALIEKEVSELEHKFNKAKKGDLIRISNINFLFNAEEIEDQSTPILEELLRIMIENPKLKIAIHGHICCNPDGMDTKLSYRRALVIFKYLRDNGIAMNRLSYKGFGSNDPIFRLPERNEAERKANRRVEILIVEQ